MPYLTFPHVSVAVSGFLLLAAAATPAFAQIRIDKDQTGRTIAIVGLPTSDGCVRQTATGHVVDRSFEKGEMRGFTFNQARYGDGYINLPAAYEIKDRAAFARVQAALDDLLRKGARLKISSVACGAGGRMIDLSSATLIDDAPARRTAPVAATTPGPDRLAATAPLHTRGGAEDDDSVLRSPDGPAVASAAPTPSPSRPQVAPDMPSPQTASRPSRWRFSQSSPAQVHLLIRSNDGAFSFAVHCERKKDGLAFRHVFDQPRSWTMVQSATPASIDGRPQRWDVDGTFEGAFFSDNLGGSSMGLSGDSLRQIANGERFVIHGKKGKPRDAVFNTVGGEQAFEAFEASCKRLRVS
ncbi:MAG TPA: hypothetical protein VGO06_13780 [Bosea sp. (in: a-proteobacteria)]|jgi:hypothetical protein|uniref:hypothetical protein n=1 Tax=Bosea sp. (in: a-proteobacteria) TaxID=1871050 RepID=UPI002E11E669|nr:hypothetical protein [Bosea sp. (in: a-proteobacteria)]